MIDRKKVIQLIGFVTLLGLSMVSLSSFAEDLALVRSIDDPSLEWGPCPPMFAEGCQIAVLHGDPAQPNADVFFKMPGHYDFPAHWHDSPERMALLSGTISVTYEGQAEAVLGTGMYAYGPAKVVHHGSCISDEPCVLLIAFEGPVNVMAPESTE